MNKNKFILQVSESMSDSVAEFRKKVASFLAGEIGDDEFRAFHIPMGMYEQRQLGTYMIRVRLGAGLVLPVQLVAISDIAREFTDSVLHFTTRQDVQFHGVKLENAPAILERLFEVGLSTKGGGGNCMRNITTCARAGVCPKEAFDTAPHAIAVGEYLLGKKGSYSLPRKYKITFVGCDHDCSNAGVSDLGFFARIKDGKKGFSVYGGGGLGASPQAAILLEEFVEESEVLVVAEAIRLLFEAHGDREHRHKARLRYVLRRVGEQEFASLYFKYKKTAQADTAKFSVRNFEYPKSKTYGEIPESVGYRKNILAEKNEGFLSLVIPLTLGDISVDDLGLLAQVAGEYSQGFIHAAQVQDLVISSIPQVKIEEVFAKLKSLSFDFEINSVRKIVACTGASTCKLGLCRSQGLATAVEEKLQASCVESLNTVVRISGCPNSCAQHHIAKIGLQGRSKKINGRAMPFYTILAFGKTGAGDVEFAQAVGVVPAKRVPDLMAEILSSKNVDFETLKIVSSKYEKLDGEIPEDFYYDFGSDKVFSLKD